MRAAVRVPARSPWVAAVLVASLAAAPPLDAAYAGRPVAEVLRELQDAGLTIVFTSELVRSDMLVAEEPGASEPRRILEEVLRAHGLEVREEARGVLVIVARGPGEPVGAPSIDGTVLAHGTRRAPPGATVRVVGTEITAEVAADGGFRLDGREAGSYTLTASALGYLEESREGVEVTPGSTRRVALRLHPQPFVVEEIIVRPSRVEILDERPDSTFGLGRDEIESLPHLGGDVFRALSLFPGVTANDVTARFSVHGGRPDEVKVVIDGQELYEAYHLKDYDSALSVISAHALAGASLTTGNFGAGEGDRMSGVLDLQTTDPAPGRRFILGLSVLDILAGGSGRFSEDRGAWLFTARRGSLDLAGSAIGAERPSLWDVLAKVEIETGAGLFSGRVLHASDELAFSTLAPDEFEILRNGYRSSYGWGTHQATLGDSLLVATTASVSRIDRTRSGDTLEEEGQFVLRDRRDLDVLALSQDWAWSAGPRHAVEWGWEARRYEARFDYLKDLELDIEVLAPFAAPRRKMHSFAELLEGEHFGGWVSDRIALGEDLTLELGARFDRHEATDDSLFSPRINAAWRLGERAVVRAAWGRYFQSQRPYELQVEDGESALFKAELSEHWVLGYEALLRDNRAGLDAVRVELYRRDVRDPRRRYESLLEALNFFPEIEPDRVRVEPLSSRSQGVELFVRGSRGERFEWFLSYARSRAEDRLSTGTVPRPLDQTHAGAVDLNWRLSKGWNLNVAWRYHTGWPTTPVEGRTLPDPEDPEGPPRVFAVFTDLYSARLADYHRLDARASRRWERDRGTLTFFVDVQNLYDRRNLAGFDVTIDDNGDFERLQPESWPGIFPSLGITWEF